MSTTTLKENKMGVMPVGKLLVNMALPMIISMLVQALYNVIDSIYVSQVSESAVTALALAFPIQNLMIAVGTGTGVGVGALLSRALGEKNQKDANRLAEHGCFLAVLSYIAFLLIGLFGSRIFFAVQTDVPEIVEGRIRTAWQKLGLMDLVRKSYAKGNLKVAYHLKHFLL